MLLKNLKKMSGEEFREKLDNFFNYMLENYKEKDQNEFINANYNEIKDFCNK